MGDSNREARPSRKEYPEGCKLWVGGLDDTCTEDELRDLFKKHGSLAEVWVARNPAGFAFVTYEDPGEAADAIRTLHETDFKDKKLKVEVAKKRDDKPLRDSGKDNKRGCFTCGRDGHYARECPQSKDGGGGRGGDRDRDRDRDYGRDSGRDQGGRGGYSGRDDRGGRDYGRDDRGGRDMGRDPYSDRGGRDMGRDYGRDDRRGDGYGSRDDGGRGRDQYRDAGPRDHGFNGGGGGFRDDRGRDIRDGGRGGGYSAGGRDYGRDDMRGPQAGSRSAYDDRRYDDRGRPSATIVDDRGGRGRGAYPDAYARGGPPPRDFRASPPRHQGRGDAAPQRPRDRSRSRDRRAPPRANNTMIGTGW